MINTLFLQAMIITRGNIVFRRLTHDDIELVRKHRNSHDVSQFMEYREHITREMQEKWFKSINNINNMYFVIEYKGTKIGLINGKDINYEKLEMETGVFIWDQKYLNTHIPLLAVLIFGEIGVRILGLTAYAHILKSNHRAKRYNRLLGFRICEDQDNKENQLYKMTPKSYLKNSNFIRGAFMKLIGNGRTILEFEDHDLKDGFSDFLYPKLLGDHISSVDEINGLKKIAFKNI